MKAAGEYLNFCPISAFSVGAKSARSGPYLSWRFSYLLVGTFFGILSALLGMPWLINADYEAFLARCWAEPVESPEAVSPVGSMKRLQGQIVIYCNIHVANYSNYSKLN